MLIFASGQNKLLNETKTLEAISPDFITRLNVKPCQFQKWSAKKRQFFGAESRKFYTTSERISLIFLSLCFYCAMESFGEVVYINRKGSFGVDFLSDQQMERMTGWYSFWYTHLLSLKNSFIFFHLWTFKCSKFRNS